MLDFQDINLGMKKIIDSYTFNYGGNSCQYSFASSFYLKHKYGDMFCEHDGFLYILRSKRCSENERVYLFPLGECENYVLGVGGLLKISLKMPIHITAG